MARMIEEPSNSELAEKIGLKTHAQMPFYDLIIIGARSSWLSAAVYGASEGLSTLLIERQAPGGQAGMSSNIENYLGFPSGLSGSNLASGLLFKQSIWCRNFISTGRCQFTN